MCETHLHTCIWLGGGDLGSAGNINVPCELQNIYTWETPTCDAGAARYTPWQLLPITNCFYEFHSCYWAPSNMSEALRVALVVPKCIAEEALAQIQPVLDMETCLGLSETACGCFHSGLVGSLSGHLSLLCLKLPPEQHNKAVILSEE